MKFNGIEGEDILVHGDIESNSIGIDVNNIDFIITILSTNLYSNPIQSFIRETVSNAWDSHIEAGSEDPVVIELGYDNVQSSHFCRIQDFGVGLSPERFENIYTKIGSSTKRGSNEQLGGYGIGRFAALAYSDIVYITSNYDGTKYKYMMYKDSNKLKVDLLFTQDTEERNGVEVYVTIKQNDFMTFDLAIKDQLPYFENLYYISSNSYNSKEFNELKIKRYKTFNVNNICLGNYPQILLGKVLYPFDIRKVNLPSEYDVVKNLPIAIPFEIGELEVTPNREQIQYNSRVISRILEKVEKVCNEYNEIVAAVTTKDFTDPEEYYRALNTTQYVTLLESETGPTVSTRYTLEPKLTFNGKSYDKNSVTRIYREVVNRRAFIRSYRLENDRYIKCGVARSLHDIKPYITKTVFAKYSELNKYGRDWIKDQYPEGALLFLLPTEKQILEFYRKSYKSLYVGDRKIDFLKIIFKYYIEKVKSIPTITNGNVPKSFIEKKKKEARESRANRVSNIVRDSDLITIHRLGWGQRGSIIRESSVGYKYEVLHGPIASKNFKKYVIHGEPSDPTLYLAAEIFLRQNLTFVEIAKTKRKLVKDLPNFIPIEEFNDIMKFKSLRKLATADMIIKTCPTIQSLANSRDLRKINSNIYDIVNTLSDYYGENRGDQGYRRSDFMKAYIADIAQLCEEQNYYDEETLAILKNNQEVINKLSFLNTMRINYQDIPEERFYVCIDYILARKILIPDAEILQKMKIYNESKKEENESN